MVWLFKLEKLLFGKWVFHVSLRRHHFMDGIKITTPKE